MAGMLKITNDENGVTFNVRIVKDKNGNRLVSFYDTRYPHTKYGQFISKYYALTLTGEDGFGDCSDGLCLLSYVDDWYITEQNGKDVLAFIKAATNKGEG